MIILIFLFSFSVFGQSNLSIGSKKFTESVILAEIAAIYLEQEGHAVTHKKEIGGTKVLWNALLRGEIDIYPEYTGTLYHEILNLPSEDFIYLKEKLHKMGIGISNPIGFNNTYALGLNKRLSERLKIKKISDLHRHLNLKFGFGEEFFNRMDGWQGLKKIYQFHNKLNIRVLDHDLAYRGLSNGSLDIIDIYTTDGDIAYYDLVILEDDLNFFPNYKALYLYRLDYKSELIDFLDLIQDSLTESEMQKLNFDSKMNKKTATQVAAEWLKSKFKIIIPDNKFQNEIYKRFKKRTSEHLNLVLISLSLAILVGLPLAIASYKFKWLGNVIVLVVSFIQTIPSLALLVLLIPILSYFGMPSLGPLPALIALFLYSLLPIVGNTLSGLNQIPASLNEMAKVLNLPFYVKLFKIELPLAKSSIFVGIKIAAVLNVGFATLGALIGAGGYGQFILTGIRLDDYSLILLGALPAAILAIVIQYGMEPFFKLLIFLVTKLKQSMVYKS